MELDREVKTELMDSFSDLYEEIEICLNNLTRGSDIEELNCLFRAIHNIKGNAGICQVTPIVEFAHALEDVAESLRSSQFSTNDMVCEAFLLGMDRLRDIHQRELRGKHYDNLREADTITLFQELAGASDITANEISSKIMSFMGAGVTLDVPLDSQIESKTDVDIDSVLTKVDDKKLHKDLLFFKELAEQVDKQNSFWQGRTATLFDWAHKINAIGGNIVNYEQLTAAIYLHDIGMSFIPSQVFDKKDKLTQEEIVQIRRHPIWGYEYLSRIAGWEEAATIILHHHEHVDGEGFPSGLTLGDIHPGARLFAIVDVFYSLTHGRADRTHNRTMMRALSAINARIDSHFDGMWVQCFNHMIRKEIKEGRLQKTQ